MNHIETPKWVKFPLGDGTYQVVRIAVVDNNAHRMFGYNPLTNRLEDVSDLEVVEGKGEGEEAKADGGRAGRATLPAKA